MLVLKADDQKQVSLMFGQSEPALPYGRVPQPPQAADLEYHKREY